MINIPSASAPALAKSGYLSHPGGNAGPQSFLLNDSRKSFSHALERLSTCSTRPALISGSPRLANVKVADDRNDLSLHSFAESSMLDVHAVELSHVWTHDRSEHVDGQSQSTLDTPPPELDAHATDHVQPSRASAVAAAIMCQTNLEANHSGGPTPATLPMLTNTLSAAPLLTMRSSWTEAPLPSVRARQLATQHTTCDPLNVTIVELDDGAEIIVRVDALDASCEESLAEAIDRFADEEGLHLYMNKINGREFYSRVR